MSLAEQVRKIRKGRSIVLKTNANIAKVTAWRVLGRGNYATTVLSPKQTKVRRIK